MKRSWATPWAMGALTVFLAYFTWVGLVLGQAHAEWLMGAIIVMAFVTSNSAGLAAFIIALKAPQHGFLLGLGMAPLAAVLAVISNLAIRLAGVHIELSGLRGILGLFAVTMVYGFFVAVVGALIGLWMRRRHVKEALPVAAELTPIADLPPSRDPQPPG